ARQVEEAHGFRGHGVDHAGDPTHGAGVDGFDDQVVYADEDLEVFVHQGAEPGDAAHVGAGFLDGLHVRELGGQLGDLRRQEVGLVGDGVVVEHARQVGGLEDLAHVAAHLAVVGGVHVGRQHHEAAGAGGLGVLGEPGRFGGG